MATVELTKENFESIIENNDIVLVDFWADWCGPCKAFEPIFEKASEAHPEMVFGKVDTEAQQELAGSFGIRSIPNLMVFRDQVLLYNQPGMLPEDILEQIVSRVAGLDMEEVRQAIAEEKAKESE